MIQSSPFYVMTNMYVRALKDRTISLSFLPDFFGCGTSFHFSFISQFIEEEIRVRANRHFIQHFTRQYGFLMITRSKHTHTHTRKRLSGFLSDIHGASVLVATYVENSIRTRLQCLQGEDANNEKLFCHFYWYIQTVVVFFISTIFVFHYFRIKDDICQRKTFQLFSACRAFFTWVLRTRRKKNFLHKSPLNTRLQNTWNNVSFYVLL